MIRNFLHIIQRLGLCLLVPLVIVGTTNGETSEVDVPEGAQTWIDVDFREGVLPEGFDPVSDLDYGEFVTAGYVINIMNDRDELVTGGISGKRINLYGDFELTFEYSIEQIEAPLSGSGSGPKIYLQLGHPKRSNTGAAITLAHFLTPEREWKYVTVIKPTDAQNRLARLIDAPPVMNGQLRIKRIGRQLIFFGLNEHGELVELIRGLVSTQDLTFMSLASSVSGAGHSRIVFKKLTVVQSPPTQITKPQLLVAITLAVGLGVALLWSYRLIHKVD